MTLMSSVVVVRPDDLGKTCMTLMQSRWRMTLICFLMCFFNFRKTNTNTLTHLFLSSLRTQRNLSQTKHFVSILLHLRLMLLLLWSFDLLRHLIFSPFINLFHSLTLIIYCNLWLSDLTVLSSTRYELTCTLDFSTKSVGSQLLLSALEIEPDWLAV